MKQNNDRIIYEQSSAVDNDDITSTMMDGTHLRGIVSKAISNDEYDGSDNGSSNELVADVMDDDEAEEARKYFGVF